MAQWFRLYNTILDDPKVQNLPCDLFKHWINILALACRHDGKIPTAQDCAFALRIDDIGAVSVLDRLLIAGLIEKVKGGPIGWHIAPHNWAKWQYKSDTSTERVKRFRAVSHTVPETAPETETETETEQKGSVVGNATSQDEWKILEGKLRQAAGWQNEPHPNLFVVGPIVELLKTGASLELDVLPTISARAPQVSAKASWRYFVGPIQDAVKARLGARALIPDDEAANAARRKAALEKIQEHNRKVDEERQAKANGGLHA